MGTLHCGEAHAITCVLADDHETLLDASESLLLAEGIPVLGKATTGVGVLQLLEEQPVTTVVVDLRLPDMDGLEVTRR
ncbi:MAG: response regulator, partial [Actinomycetota bacterium]